MKLKFLKSYYHGWVEGGNNEDGILFLIIYDEKHSYLSLESISLIKSLNCHCITYNGEECLFVPDYEYGRINNLVRELKIQFQCEKDMRKIQSLSTQSTKKNHLDKILEYIDVDKEIVI